MQPKNDWNGKVNGKRYKVNCPRAIEVKKALFKVFKF